MGQKNGVVGVLVPVVVRVVDGVAVGVVVPEFDWVEVGVVELPFVVVLDV